MSLIEVRDLRKTYGELRAVDGVSFDVAEAQIFGILGPNGAGKTTTLEMVEALRPIDSGTVTISGVDVKKNPTKVKNMIGVQLQSTSLFNHLTVAELVDLFASFYNRTVNVKEILDEVSMADKAGSYVPALSGGQKQRVSVALALVNDPIVVFLDEPTTGLDPQARRHLWDVVERTREKGKSVVLTTHYMEEAETLCDHLLVMDHGTIIESGSPRELIQRHAGDSAIEFVSEAIPAAKIEALPAVDSVKSAEGRHYVFTKDTHGALVGLLDLSKSDGFKADQLQVRGGTLEDVFVSLTGRRLRD